MNATGYFLSSNTHALVVDSVSDESRLEFYTGTGYRGLASTGGIALAASNASLYTYRESNVLTRAYHTGSVPVLAIPNGELRSAVVRTDRVEVAAATGSRKAVVLRDFNAASAHQFAGFGYANATLVHQVPSETAAHTFVAALDAETSAQLMRVARHPTTHQTQVVIGAGTATSNTALHVGGHTVVEGDLTVSGNFEFTDESIVRVDPATSQIPVGLLPSNLVSLNASNLIDASILPQTYAFQYLRAGKNVGIGTRSPQQKLHVEGVAVVRPRLGVGTLAPSATLHVHQSTAISPAVLIESDVAAAPLSIRVAGAPFVHIDGVGGVGIGTDVVQAGVKLHVAGALRIDGAFIVDGIKFGGMEWAVDDAVYLKTETVAVGAGTEEALLCHAPLLCTNRLSTPSIGATGTSNVHFQCGMDMDGDAAIAGGLRVAGAVVFEQAPVVVSDARVKSDVRPISDALERLSLLRGYTYVKDGQAAAGLLAQEVAAALPQAVATLDNGRMAVSYDGVVALLVEAIHDLRQQVGSK
jgi:hypothetical protein